VADQDSALHLSLTHRAALNVDVVLEKMASSLKSDEVKDPSMHFKDIFHELVDYKMFKDYLSAMDKGTPEMENHKIVRVLKDPSVNAFSLLCCCRKTFPENKEDEKVIQSALVNTMLFWPTMISGITPDTMKFEIPVDKDEISRYRCEPINVRSVRFDWLLENVSDDDRQPYVYRLLKEIMKKDQTEEAQGFEGKSFYEIPAVQSMIRFHHGKLQDYIWQPFIFGMLMLDLVQILIQIVLINLLIDTAAKSIENEESIITYTPLTSEECEDCYDPETIKGLQYAQLVFSGTQVILII
jgi:hypothetical protein